jgi:hypothetical protein
MYLITEEVFNKLFTRTPSYITNEIGRQMTCDGYYIVTEYQMVQLSNSNHGFISELKRNFIENNVMVRSCGECTGKGGTCIYGSQCTGGLVDNDNTSSLVCKNFYSK